MTASDLALAAVAGFAISEATGTTNVTGGDAPLPTPDQGPSMSDFASLLQAQQNARPSVTEIAEAVQSDQPSVAEIAEAVQSDTQPVVVESGSGGNDAATANALASMQQQVNALVERVEEQREETTDTVTDTTDTVEGVQELREEFENWRENLPTPTPDEGDGSDQQSEQSEQSDRYDLQRDYDGIFGEEVRGGAEILHQSGNVVDSVTDAPGDAIDFAGTSGRTIGEAWKLITTGEADTSETHAEDRGEVMIDYSGDGSPGGNLTDRLPDFDLGGNDESDEQQQTSDEQQQTNDTSIEERLKDKFGSGGGGTRQLAMR